VAKLTKQQIQKIQLASRRNPRFFFRDYMATPMWEMQYRIAESVRDNRITTVKSCHGSGKTYSAARIGLQFLLAYQNSVVVTTAPTDRQVKQLLWRELRAAKKRSKYPYPGKVSTKQLEIGETWYAIGLSAKEPDAFQGFHADHILIIVDEAAGVPEPIFEAVDALATSANARVLMIGNPTSSGGAFYESHRSHLANKLHISVWDTPNFVINDLKRCEAIGCIKDHHPAEAVVEAIENRVQLKVANPALVSPQWVYERIFKWGIGTPLWDARVEGEFPKAGERTLIPLNLVELAMEAERHDSVKTGNSRYGVDVARSGSDKSAIYHRRGHKGESIRAWHTRDTTLLGDAVAQLNPTDHLTWVIIEAMGLGATLYDYVAREARENERRLHKILPVDTASSPTVKDPGPGEEQFANLRSEMWWKVSRLFINGEIAIPDDEDLKVDLSAVEWFLKNGKITVESKDDLKKRIGRSPDRGDALVISYAPVGEENVLVLEEPERVDEPETYTGGLLGKEF
jgi:phage terminase large subunit